MIARKLNLVQSNFRQGPKSFNAFFLPYSAGILWSYANTRSEIRDRWTLDHLIYNRVDIDQTYKDLADCDVIGFSNYVWSKAHNYKLAAAIKSYNPRCLIVFGGPQTPVAKADVFEQLPFIDAVVKQEGEIAFADILERFDSNSMTDIPGLVLNSNGRAVDTGPSARITDLNQIPSPYTTGVFDRLIAQNPHVTWNPTIETNRGCPYQCTFCDWGSLTYSKVKHFGLERVYAELEWIGQHQCDYMTVTDANFGMFIERDEMIVDKIIETQKQYGFPLRVAMGGWAKNQKSDVLRLAAKFYSYGFNNGHTVSVQSLDDKVLRNIKRTNLPTKQLRAVFEAANRLNMAVTTEMILGLPGETKESWRASMFKILDLNQHNGIEVWHGQLLENAEMNLTQKDVYDIRTVTVYDYLSGTDDYDDVPEGLEVIASTTDMPREDMISSLEFYWFMNTWHINGISQWYSRFLRKYHDIPYAEFYGAFQKWLLRYDWWNHERDMVLDAYSRWLDTGTLDIESVCGMKIHGWNHQHVTKMRMHDTRANEDFHRAVYEFVSVTYGALLSEEIVDDLDLLSNAYVVDWHRLTDYPMQVVLNHNIVDYVLDLAPLVRQSTPYRCTFDYDLGMTKEEFTANLLFKRRRNFGRSAIHNNYNESALVD